MVPYLVGREWPTSKLFTLDLNQGGTKVDYYDDVT